MAQLRQDYQKYAARDTEVIAIGPEGAESFTRWWHENKMPFIGIPDPKHVVANLYGQKSKLLKGGRMPALAVIDKEARIRLMYYGDSMSDILSDEQVLSLLTELNEGDKAKY